jgi:hypothetical protein
VLSSRLLRLHQAVSLSMVLGYLSSEIRPTRLVSSANLSGLADVSLEEQSFV